MARAVGCSKMSVDDSSAPARPPSCEASSVAARESMPASISGTSALSAEPSEDNISLAFCSTWSSMRACCSAAETRVTSCTRSTA